MSMKRVILFLNCIVLAIGACGGPLIMRLYFIHGGKRVWLSSCLQAVGFPILFIPLLFNYALRRRQVATAAGTKIIYMKPRLFLAAAGIGIITGFSYYLYAYGMARLPVSTSSLILACQLGFTAGFAYLLVKQKFTRYSVISIILLTAGGAVLALNTSGDRPAGESNKQYIAGFLMMVADAVMFGLTFPLVELTYAKAKQQITYTLVLEIQFVVSLFATIFCTVGMLINHDFQVISREATEFELGEKQYYIVLVCIAIILQCYFLGAIGVIFSSSSLFSAMVIALLLPVTELLGVIFFKEKFQVEKGISLILNLCGFFSYFYGEVKHNKKKKVQNVDENQTSLLQSTSD